MYRRRSAGAPRARPPTRRRWPWIRRWPRPTGAWPTSRTTPSAMPRSRPWSALLASGDRAARQCGAAALRARQGLRTAPALSGSLRPLRARQCPAAPRCAVRYREVRAAHARASAPSSTRHSLPRHAGSGTRVAAPIFIVGLPRSGSTLVEQILASHPRVEGTMELPNILNIMHQFDDMVPSRDGYPETLGAAPDGAVCRARQPLPRGDRAAPHRA